MKLFRLPHLLLLVLLALGASAPAMAQRPGGPGSGPRMERLESARVAYITEKLALTPEQSQRFWPLFNEYTEKRRALRRQVGEARRGTDYSAMGDKEIRAALNQQFAMRQNELNLEKEYVGKFEKVITLRQVAQLQQAEREFTKALIKRLDNRPAQATTTND